MMKGKITVSRIRCSHSSHTADYINVTLTDKSSGIQFADVKIGVEDFARVITGQDSIPCEIEFRSLENVGKKCVTETFEVARTSLNRQG